MSKEFSSKVANAAKKILNEITKRIQNASECIDVAYMLAMLSSAYILSTVNIVLWRQARYTRETRK